MKTILKDMLGNEIREGALLFWTSLKAPVKVLSIEPLTGGDPKKPQGKITVSIPLTFDAGRPEYFLNDFVLAVDPEQTKAIEALLPKSPVKENPDAVDTGGCGV